VGVVMLLSVKRGWDAGLKGEDSGVFCCWRRGEGEAGDSGRRKGELRGEPYCPSGEGLYDAVAWIEGKELDVVGDAGWDGFLLTMVSGEVIGQEKQD